jgi:drug/metabolite transporter (DMT)-like permease
MEQLVKVMRESSVHKRKNQVLIVVVVLSNVLGNVALSHGMRQTGAIVSASPLDYARAFANLWTVTGVVVLAGWMASNLALLSRADLSFVLPVTASGYVLIALAGQFWLGERISWVRWLGIVAIALGVILAEETPSRTTEPDAQIPSFIAESDSTAHSTADFHPEHRV